MLYSIDLTLGLFFAGPVWDHHFNLRILPRPCSTVNIKTWGFSIDGADYVSRAEDAFGNPILYGSILGEHSRFIVKTWGKVEIQQGWDNDQRGLILYGGPSPLVQPSEPLGRFLKEVEPTFRSLPVHEGVAFLNESVFRRLSYEPGRTTLQTSTTEVLSLGKGVCQDYAHVLIGLLRGFGLPARYVSGYVEGEGKGHAWVEAYYADRWYGWDPTNNRPTNEGIVKVAHGRDAGDVRMNIGVFKGGSSHDSKILVDVQREEQGDG